MVFLVRNANARTGEVAHELGCSTPTVTGLMDRLVAKGLVSRAIDPQDRRAVLHTLTTEGRQTLRDIAAMMASLHAVCTR